jgi:hypothetical protein
MITKYKGGRGKTAPYRTLVVRIPEPLLNTVEQLVNSYRESGIIPVYNKTCNRFLSRQEIATKLEQLRKDKKITSKDVVNHILNLIDGGDDG